MVSIEFVKAAQADMRTLRKRLEAERDSLPHPDSIGPPAERWAMEDRIKVLEGRRRFLGSKSAMLSDIMAKIESLEWWAKVWDAIEDEITAEIEAENPEQLPLAVLPLHKRNAIDRLYKGLQQVQQGLQSTGGLMMWEGGLYQRLKAHGVDMDGPIHDRAYVHGVDVPVLVSNSMGSSHLQETDANGEPILDENGKPKLITAHRPGAIETQQAKLDELISEIYRREPELEDIEAVA